MHIRAAHAAVGNFDIAVPRLKRLGLELLPDHVALGGAGVQAHPALKLVVGLCHCV